MTTLSSRSFIDVPMKDKTKEIDFYDGDVDIWGTLITTYDMRKVIQVVKSTYDVIGNHNNLSASNLVLVVVPWVYHFREMVS